MNNIEHHKLLSDMNHETYKQKNNDYGDSFSKVYKRLGIISAVTQIAHKYNRLEELAMGAEQKVHEESIRDTLLDMANYCIMTVMEIDNESREVNKDGQRQETEGNNHA